MPARLATKAGIGKHVPAHSLRPGPATYAVANGVASLTAAHAGEKTSADVWFRGDDWLVFAGAQSGMV